jgi:hypothetical protein
MVGQPIPIESALSLINETDTAMLLLDEGIRVFETWDGGADRRVLGLHLCAQGFERFLKLTIALVTYCKHGTLPTAKSIRVAYGHRLLPLLKVLIEEVEHESDFVSRPAISDDLDFLRSDAHLRRIFEILSDFGTHGRYHDLDVLLHGPSRIESPLDRWNALETDLHHADVAMVRVMCDNPGVWSQVWHPQLARLQVAQLQRTARAIARVWTLGPAAPEGKRLVAYLGRFLYLTDDQLAVCPTRWQG